MLEHIPHCLGLDFREGFFAPVLLATRIGRSPEGSKFVIEVPVDINSLGDIFLALLGVLLVPIFPSKLVALVLNHPLNGIDVEKGYNEDKSRCEYILDLTIL